MSVSSLDMYYVSAWRTIILSIINVTWKYQGQLNNNGNMLMTKKI